jgi:hypothetical protein
MKRMTFEERIDRLTEGHEALAQTVELLAMENRQIAAENQKRDRRLGEIMESLASLVRVAEMHENRITHVEDRLG